MAPPCAHESHWQLRCTWQPSCQRLENAPAFDASSVKAFQCMRLVIVPSYAPAFGEARRIAPVLPIVAALCQGILMVGMTYVEVT